MKKDQSIKRVLLTCYDPDVYRVYREIYESYKQQEYKQVADWVKPVKKALSDKAKQTKQLLTSVMKNAPTPLLTVKKRLSLGSLFQSKHTLRDESKPLEGEDKK